MGLDIPDPDPTFVDDDEEDDADDEQGDDTDADLPLTATQSRVIPPSLPIPTEGLLPSPMSKYWCPPVQQLLHDLFISLYTQLPEGQDDRWFSPLLRYIPYRARRKDGTFIQSSEITQIIATLTFGGRITMLSIVHAQVLRDSAMRYST
jgi:hypothetical protein